MPTKLTCYLPPWIRPIKYQVSPWYEFKQDTLDDYDTVLPFISEVNCDFVNFPKASKPSVQVLFGASVFYSTDIDDPTILL